MNPKPNGKSGWKKLLDLDDWHAKPPSDRNLFGGLDGIRGIAILLVVATHCVPFLHMDTPLKRWLSVACSNGAIGVWLFFVLSGFLISLPFYKRLTKPGEWCPPGYALRRAAKVIPPLYVSIILLTLFIIWKDHTWTPVRGALETMLFFHIFRSPNPIISPIYWTLAAEVTFYSLLPGLVFALRTPLKTMPWLIPLVMMGLSTCVWAGVAAHPEVVASQPFIRDVLLSLNFFGWGALFSYFHLARPRITGKQSGFCVSAGLAGLLACCEISTHYWLEQKSYVLNGLFSRLAFTNAVGASAFLTLFVIHGSRAAACRFLSNSLLTLAGLISYEWYLFHSLFVDFSNLITGSDLHGSYGKLMIRVFFAFPAAFIFSAIFYRAFSLPILRWAHGGRLRKANFDQ